MKRPITGFHLDEESHWVAELSCGHGQHTRHIPPFTERSWVLTPEGRASRLRSELECVRCDRREIPDGYAPYRRTPEFTEASIPAALTRTHATKPGIWGLIRVASGSLEVRVHPPFERREVLGPEHPGVVLPEVEHHVAPLGAVAFYVEFWRRGSEG